MIELGELEARHEEFARRQTRVVVVSNEGQDDASKTVQPQPRGGRLQRRLAGRDGHPWLNITEL